MSTIVEELDGLHVRDRVLTGEPLTDIERATLLVLSEVGPYVGVVAVAQRTHVNTAKYRLDRIRQKYGLPITATTHWDVLREAIRRGDVVTEDGQKVIADFIADVNANLGQIDSLNSGAFSWIASHATRYLRRRTAA